MNGTTETSNMRWYAIPTRATNPAFPYDAPPPPGFRRSLVQRPRSPLRVSSNSGMAAGSLSPGNERMPSNWGKLPLQQGQPVHEDFGVEAITSLDPRPQPDIANLEPKKLPWGWEKGFTPQGDTFYIDHVRQTTTRTDPRSLLNVAYINGLLCDHCQAMIGDNMAKIEGITKKKGIGIYLFFQPHGSTLQDFTKAVLEGCFICCVVAAEIRKQKLQQNSLNLADHQLCIDNYFIGTGTITFTLKCSSGPDCSLMHAQEIGVSLETLEPHQFNMPYMACTSPRTSDACPLDMAKKWIHNCCEAHIFCKEGYTGTLSTPTRLMDIGNAEATHWKLVVTKKHGIASVDYVALSYCWGNTPQMRLLTTTQEEFEDGQPISALPKTHRELITLARHLEIRFVWIDALCIVQDSKEDWLRESIAMADVYGNSKVTVAAAASVNAEGGLFRERDTRPLQPLLIRQPNRAYMIHSKDYWHNHVEDTPLSLRGWALQEKILPNRVLYFSHEQVLFECREHRACEGFPTGAIALGEISHKLNTLSSVTKDPDPAKQQRELLLTWEDIVSRYQQCAFKYPPDKLLAISGITQAIEHKTGDKCFAGLWESRLLYYLGWSTRGLERSYIPEIRAPSWSWISMQGHIEFERLMMIATDQGESSVSFSESMPFVDIIRIFAETERDETDELILRGEIHLRGSLFPAELGYYSSETLGGYNVIMGRFGRKYLDVDGPIYRLAIGTHEHEAFPDVEMMPARAKNPSDVKSKPEETLPDDESKAPSRGSIRKYVLSKLASIRQTVYTRRKDRTKQDDFHIASAEAVPMGTKLYGLLLYAGLVGREHVSLLGLMVVEDAKRQGHFKRIGTFRDAWATRGRSLEEMGFLRRPDKKTFYFDGMPEARGITLI